MLDQIAAAALPTRNAHWGFFGSASRWARPDAPRAWEAASLAIAARTGGTPEAVRDFLDSREGRHFADEVENHLAGGAPLGAATDAAVERYSGWRIGRALSRETGIPAGLPVLAGWVAWHEIHGEEE